MKPQLKLPAGFLAFFPADSHELLNDAVADGVEEYANARALLAMKNVLIANFQPALGLAIYADITGKADASNSALVNGTVSRQAVSKAATRIRRGLGLPVRVPKNARPGKKAANRP